MEKRCRIWLTNQMQRVLLLDTQWHYVLDFEYPCVLLLLLCRRVAARLSRPAGLTAALCLLNTLPLLSSPPTPCFDAQRLLAPTLTSLPICLVRPSLFLQQPYKIMTHTHTDRQFLRTSEKVCWCLMSRPSLFVVTTLIFYLFTALIVYKTLLVPFAPLLTFLRIYLFLFVLNRFTWMCQVIRISNSF